MIRIIKEIKQYFPFAVSAIQIKLSYKMNTLVFIFGGLIRTFVTYYLWKAVFLNSNQAVLNGFTVQEMMSYIFISSFNLRFIENNVDTVIGFEVKDGSIAMNLIKPINYHIKMFFNALGDLLHVILFVFLPLWVGYITIRYIQVQELPPDIGTIGIYFLSLFMGFFIMFLFNFCFGLLAFYITNIWGIGYLKKGIVRFFSGELIPFTFFPVWMQFGLKFFPFGSMNYVPSMIYLKKLIGISLLKALGLQVFWILFMLILSIWVWNKAVKRLTVLGG